MSEVEKTEAEVLNDLQMRAHIQRAQTELALLEAMWRSANSSASADTLNGLAAALNAVTAARGGA